MPLLTRIRVGPGCKFSCEMSLVAKASPFLTLRIDTHGVACMLCIRILLIYRIELERSHSGRMCTVQELLGTMGIDQEPQGTEVL